MGKPDRIFLAGGSDVLVDEGGRGVDETEAGGGVEWVFG